MDFALGSEAQEWCRHVSAFMDAHVYPAEKEAHDQAAASSNYYSDPEIVVELRKKAKARASGTCFCPTTATARASTTSSTRRLRK